MVGSTSPRGQRRTDFGQVSQWWLSLFIIRLSLCLSLGQWWLSFYQAGIFYGKLSTHHMNLLHLHRRPNHEQQTTISFRGCPAFLRSAKINDFLMKQFPHQPPRAPSLVKCPPLCCSITLRHHLSFLKGNHMLAAILTEDSPVSFFLPPFSASNQLRWRKIEKVSRQIRCQPFTEKQSAAH